MAINRWLNQDGNWDNTSNWSRAAVPVATDHIMFDSGSQDLTNKGGGALDIGATVFTGGLSITPGYSGKIGATGNPLKIDLNSVLRCFGSGSEHWFDFDAQTCPEVHAGPKQITANGCQLKGTITKLHCYGGKTVLDNGATIGSLLRMTRQAGLPEPSITIPSGVTVAGAELQVKAGIVSTSPSWPNILQSGGQIDALAGTIAAFRGSGGTLKLQAATVTVAYLFDRAQFDGASYTQWTVTTMYADGPNVVVDLRNGAGIEPVALNAYDGARVIYDGGMSL